MAKGKFEYWKGKNGWFWHLKARNGEILSHSESYTTERGCKKGINSAINAAGDASLIPEKRIVKLKSPPKK
jgi:uncharacterized protein YegP (UPF0339 family)